MRIFGMRHGHAGAAAGLQDQERYLSQKGRAEVSDVARALRDAGTKLDHVWTSPLVRAVQTAELVANVLGFTGEVCILPELAHTASPIDAARQIAQTAALRVLVVGHMPTLPATLQQLSRSSCPMNLETAQVVCVEDQRALWTLTAYASAVHRL